jgi:hypothetical protein
MDPDLVGLDDVMGSMVESLLEQQPVAFEAKYAYQDVEIDFKIGGKPPRDVFYRNTSRFLTNLPPAIPDKNCKCMYLCSGDLAAVKCFTCSMYDVQGSYVYCQRCFDHRHPWYRMPHIFTDIAHDENIGHSMIIANRIADVSESSTTMNR